jgi:hypothetical protein
MARLNSQQIVSYYERYKTTSLTFTKEIIEVTGLITKQVSLKCLGVLWPCILYSSSFEGAKIIANIKSGLVQKLQEANNVASLKFCFNDIETEEPIAFFVACRAMGYTFYGGSEEMIIINLQFTQRTPDDLITILGRILDAHVNSTKRRGERISITENTLRKLNIVSKDTMVSVQGVPRQCILRDISFYGAKLIIMGLAKFLEDREAVLTIDFDEPRRSYTIKGKFIRSEIVEGRKELVALAMTFDEASVPMGYKIRINNYISQVRADNRPDQTALQEQAQKNENEEEGSPKADVDAGI